MAELQDQDAGLSSRRDQPTWGCFASVGFMGVVVVGVTAVVRGTRPASEGWLTLLLVLPFLGLLGGTLVAAAIFGAHARLARYTPDRVVCRRGIPLDRTRPTLGGVVLLWLVAAIWNLPVAVAAEWAVQSAIPVSGDGWMLGLLLLVSGTGWIVFAVVATLEELPYLRGLRPVLLELSLHPLKAGGEYELSVSVPGPVELRRLHVRLRGEEFVRVHAADEETEARVFHDQELLAEADLTIDATPFSTRCTMVIPADARPTADLPDKVQWVVKVHGQKAGALLGFQFEYPVEVRSPAEPPGEKPTRPALPSEAITAPDRAVRLPSDDRLANGPT